VILSDIHSSIGDLQKRFRQTIHATGRKQTENSFGNYLKNVQQKYLLKLGNRLTRKRLHFLKRKLFHPAYWATANINTEIMGGLATIDTKLEKYFNGFKLYFFSSAICTSQCA